MLKILTDLEFSAKKRTIAPLHEFKESLKTDQLAMEAVSCLEENLASNTAIDFCVRR